MNGLRTLSHKSASGKLLDLGAWIRRSPITVEAARLIGKAVTFPYPRTFARLAT
jgi:hypothetical protein